MKARRCLWLAATVATLAATADADHVRAQDDVARRARVLVAGLDYEDARRELASADADDPRAAIERARLAIHEGDCDGAAAILARPELQKTEEGETLADIARGCQRATAALESDRDEARAIEIRWQDEHDRPLAPLVFDTVSRARDALTRDLGVDWPRPTRIVVVRDLLSLAAMTGLPYKSAQTTGTVAVAKWGRVTLLSPRASHHGYAWRDTIAHELTHLAVTRASRDRAPLWLQEGIAKREETRWRDPEPFDDRPPPDAVAQRGIDLGMALPLDKLGPSIAMLPSADAAMVAFAEVTSFVRFYADDQGADALPKLLARLKAGDDPKAALASASGSDWRAWETKWRAHLAAQPREPLPSLFGLGAAHEDVRKMRDLGERARLAELLLSRDHAAEAVKELDRIQLAASPVAVDVLDPSVYYLRARALEQAGRREDAAPLVADPKQSLSSYGPWWAIRGRWQRMRGEEAAAQASFAEAVASDPLDVEAACESIDEDAVPPDAHKRPLCEAARARKEPPFDE